jgi:hypothetical protein
LFAGIRFRSVLDDHPLIKCDSLLQSLPELIEAEHTEAALDQLVQSPLNDSVRVEAWEKDSVEDLTEKMGRLVV